MSIQNITFKEGNIGKVTVKIDGAHEDIEIKEIDRINTYIDIKELNDTALNNDIKIKASLYEINDTPIEHGVLSISIFSSDKKSLLYSYQEALTEDGISTSLKNRLSTGTYYVEVSYGGNKYYNESTAGKFIRINKRSIICEFDSFEYYVDAGSTFTITGKVKDLENNTPISNCAINYLFNGETNQAITDNLGRVDFTVEVPGHGEEECHGAGNKKYQLLVGMENASYVLKNTTVSLVIRKEDTSISIQGREMTITGEVLTDDGYPAYGTVDISMYEGKYIAQVTIDENEYGHFSHTINLQQLINNIESNYSGEYSDISQELSTNVFLETTDNEVEVGDSFTVQARVEDEYQNPVKSGTIDFRLYNDKNTEVYRYITELDNGGMGDFIFYTSKAGTYYVKAYYKTVVGYKPSQSNTDVIIEVNNGS